MSVELRLVPSSSAVSSQRLSSLPRRSRRGDGDTQSFSIVYGIVAMLYAPFPEITLVLRCNRVRLLDEVMCQHRLVIGMSAIETRAICII